MEHQKGAVVDLLQSSQLCITWGTGARGGGNDEVKFPLGKEGWKVPPHYPNQFQLSIS